MRISVADRAQSMELVGDGTAVAVAVDVAVAAVAVVGGT